MTMRKILFRGKSLKDGQWRQGSLFVANYNGKDINVLITNPVIDRTTKASSSNGLEFDEADVDIPDPHTVGQYIGLNDKNGKGIFEGDIVRWDDLSSGKYWRFAVVRLAPDILFDCRPIIAVGGINNSSTGVFAFSSFIYTETDKHLEVIGNMFDNPELVKQS